MPGYVENIRDGVSTITCMDCGEVVKFITRHEREHALLAAVMAAPDDGRICERCGQPAQGYAQINDAWYCHPDDPSRPDCYSLVGWSEQRDSNNGA